MIERWHFDVVSFLLGASLCILIQALAETLYRHSTRRKKHNET